MNRIVYVPVDETARANDRSVKLVIEIGRAASPKILRAQSPRAADQHAYHQGWMRFSALPPSERLLYRT